MRKIRIPKSLLIVFGLIILLAAGAERVAADDAPVVTAFTVPDSSLSFTVPIGIFTATDDVAVTSYLITENLSAPDLQDPAWIPVAPVEYTFASEGVKILYAWAKDGEGNVSISFSAVVNVGSGVDITAPAAPDGLNII